MRNILCAVFFSGCISIVAFSQTDSNLLYKKTSVMIPMRDGIRLHTVIFSPVNIKKSVPILIQRTPYGTPSLPDDTVITIGNRLFYLYIGR
jgi:predicted acyl esterase